VTATLQGEAQVKQALESMSVHRVEDDVRRRLGDRVAVSVDGLSIILYAAAEDAARETERIVREILAQRELTAEFALDRWHPIEQEWEDAGTPMPQTAEQRESEHQHLVAEETQESLETGQAGWEVIVEMPSRHEAVALAERLQADGHHVFRRWTYLVVGANNEDAAGDLAREIGQEVPGKASVHAQVAPFVNFHLSRTGIELVPEA
jgi:hypothetical protein